MSRSAPWIEPGDLLRPQSVLSQVQIIRAARPPARTCEHGAANRRQRVFPIHEGLLPVVRRRLDIPRSVDVAISPVGYQCRRTRLHADAGHHRQIPAGRTASDDNAPRVDVTSRRAVAANPGKRVLDIFDDCRQFDFRSQAIVEGDQDVIVGSRQFDDILGHALTAAHDERAAMNPDNCRASQRTIATIDVGFDFRGTNGLINDGLLCPRPVVGFVGHGGRQRQAEQNEQGAGCFHRRILLRRIHRYTMNASNVRRESRPIGRPRHAKSIVCRLSVQ